jgi:hypothetical protein
VTGNLLKPLVWLHPVNCCAPYEGPEGHLNETDRRSGGGQVTGNLLKPIGAGKRKCGYEACAIEGGTGGRGGLLSLCFADC